jgi:hypothetical protein
MNGYTALMRKQKARIIMRIELAPGTPQAIQRTVDQFGVTHLNLSSRAVAWFCKQDDVTQAAILGILPENSSVDPTRRFLEQVAGKSA